MAGAEMDWHGIEWAVPLYEIMMIVVPVYAFITVRRRVKQGVSGKFRALLRYAFLVLVPIILYVFFFFGLIGFENLTHSSIISEGLARTVLLLVGSGLAIWIVSTLVFGLSLVFMKKQQTQSLDASTRRKP